MYKKTRKGTLISLDFHNNLYLLDRDMFLTAHQRNLQILAAKSFTVKEELTREITKEVFKIQNPCYYFRSEETQFNTENVKATHYGIQSLRY